jgi:hypothetical protein
MRKALLGFLIQACDEVLKEETVGGEYEKTIMERADIADAGDLG